MECLMTDTHLADRIQNHKARLAVIGQGYVGLPLSVEFGRRGFSVTGIETDLDRITALNAGRSYIPDVKSEDLMTLLNRGRYEATSDFTVLERSDPGNTTFKVNNTPKVVGGMTAECSRLAALLYRQIIDQVIEVSSPKVAELAKLYENVFRNVNIALANELALMCRHLGMNTREVIDAAATKPFGFTPFYPGP